MKNEGGNLSPFLIRTSDRKRAREYLDRNEAPMLKARCGTGFSPSVGLKADLHQTENPCRISNFEFRMKNEEPGSLGILNSKFLIRNSKFKVSDRHLLLEVAEHQIFNVAFRALHRTLNDATHVESVLPREPN